jgi:hypothetical protein
MKHVVTLPPATLSVAASATSQLAASPITMLVPRQATISIIEFSLFTGEDDTAALLTLDSVFCIVTGLGEDGFSILPMIGPHNLPVNAFAGAASAGFTYTFSLNRALSVQFQNVDVPTGVLTLQGVTQYTNRDAAVAHIARVRSFLIWEQN